MSGSVQVAVLAGESRRGVKQHPLLFRLTVRLFRELMNSLNVLLLPSVDCGDPVSENSHRVLQRTMELMSKTEHELMRGNMMDSAFRALVPGAPFFDSTSRFLRKIQSSLKPSSKLKYTLPFSNFFLLVRRFVQFTGAHWDYGCFANLEKELEEAKKLLLIPRGFFRVSSLICTQ